MYDFTALNKIEISRNKATSSAIALILLLAASAFAVAVPRASAQATGNGIVIPQWAFINAFPSPVGTGQSISIFAWTTNYPPTANGAYGDRWTGITVTVMKPDGSNETLGPYTSDPVGTVFESYTPTETGNYTFQVFFPGHLINNVPNGINPSELAEAQNDAALGPGFAAAVFGYTGPASGLLAFYESIFVTGFSDIGNYYQNATSTAVSVTVQSTAIPSAPAYPLPTEYWTTPVSQSGHVAHWAYIMGDWLANGELGSNVNDYTQPPTTAHIAWTKPINFGGVGGLPSSIDIGGTTITHTFHMKECLHLQ